MSRQKDENGKFLKREDKTRYSKKKVGESYIAKKTFNGIPSMTLVVVVDNRIRKRYNKGKYCIKVRLQVGESCIEAWYPSSYLK